LLSRERRVQKGGLVVMGWEHIVGKRGRKEWGCQGPLIYGVGLEVGVNKKEGSFQ